MVFGLAKLAGCLIMVLMSEAKLRHELNQKVLNVPRAALQIARSVAYPELDVADYMNRLHALAATASEVVSSYELVEEQAKMLSTFLFEETGFRGNSDAYSDPHNSFLNEVLDRRLGIPLTLSIIYTFIAQQIGIPAYGVGLPGHFIVGVHDEDEEMWFDPYNGGRQLSLADCAFLVRSTVGYEGPLEATWFEPAAPREIVARLLNNLRIAYVRNQQWREAILVIEQLRVVQPDAAEHLRDLGLAHYRQRSLHRAAHYLNQYLQTVPEAPDAEAIQEGMRDILNNWVRQN
jgi:regulator of sirC expression with transglutaminase-like and TPR domain